MGYVYTIPKAMGYQVKKNGTYPAPCPADKKRTLKLFTDDVLTKHSDGTFTLHTGLCILGIKLKKNQVVKIGKDSPLQVI